MKTYFTAILLSTILLACNKENTEKQETPQQFDSEAAARKMFGHFNAHDWAAMGACYTDTAIFLDPSLGTDYVKQTRAQTAAKYNGLQQSIPDIHDSITHIFACGDKAVVEFISTGTLPGGGKLKLPICTVLTFKNGLVVSDATYYDN